MSNLEKTRLDQVVTVVLGIFCLIGSTYFFVLTMDHFKQTKQVLAQQDTQIKSAKGVAAGAAVIAADAATVADAAPQEAKAAARQVQSRAAMTLEKHVEQNDHKISELRKSISVIQTQLDVLRCEVEKHGAGGCPGSDNRHRANYAERL